MKQEIKERIVKINRGEVPSGYKQTKIGIVPQEWENINFSNLFESYVQYTKDLEQYPLYSLTIENGIIRKPLQYERSHLVKKEESYKIIPQNYFAYNPMNLRFGAVARHKANETASISGYYDIFKTKINTDMVFMDNFLVSSNMLRYYNVVATGSLIEKKRVHFSQFLDFNLPLPNEKERFMISQILTTQDRVIELEENLLEQKQQQKQYLMQQLLTGKTRLKGFTTEWKNIKANKIFKSITNKQHSGDLEVLSATQDRGIIPRNEVDIDIKYDVKSLKGYKKVEKGNFVISLRSFQGGIECSNFTGLVSPAYTVLSAIIDISVEYYKQYFKNADYIKKLNIAVYGIRDGKQISYDDFGQIKIPYPPLDEQNAIAEILTTADREIELIKNKIQQEKSKKKALMQLLLTGIVRVS